MVYARLCEENMFALSFYVYYFHVRYTLISLVDDLKNTLQPIKRYHIFVRIDFRCKHAYIR